MQDMPHTAQVIVPRNNGITYQGTMPREQSTKRQQYELCGLMSVYNQIKQDRYQCEWEK